MDNQQSPPPGDARPRKSTAAAANPERKKTLVSYFLGGGKESASDEKKTIQAEIRKSYLGETNVKVSLASVTNYFIICTKSFQIKSFVTRKTRSSYLKLLKLAIQMKYIKL